MTNIEIYPIFLKVSQTKKVGLLLQSISMQQSSALAKRIGRIDGASEYVGKGYAQGIFYLRHERNCDRIGEAVAGCLRELISTMLPQ